ncbi:uncharacterized protein [Nicotiana tomentosiformis]|uniref:uncharacterized protein n=1 Tax=Nicotiana tomentosiformis TaxID=4098 RepID=UPI00388C4E27
MKIVLRAKRKLGFITGTCTKDQFTHDLGEDWERVNATVLTWIMNTLLPELVNEIVYANNAHEVWADLNDRFDKISGSRFYNLHREIATVSQGTSSISTYHYRLKLLWDEYSALIPTLPITPETREFITQLEKQKLFQFLMGLNESYSAIRSKMLLMSPSPSVSRTYAMLIHEESQRKVCMSNTPMNEVSDSTALMSSRDNTQKFKRYGNLYCEYYRTKGHTKDTCYKLVGYPPGFKGKRKQEYRQTNSAMSDGFHAKDDMFQAATTADSNIARQGMHNYFIDEQYNQIMKLLNQDKGEEFAVNMAGNIDLQLTQICDIPWIIDTRATNHMTSNISLLTDITRLLTPKEDLCTGKVKEIGKEKGGLYLVLPYGSSANKPRQQIKSCLVEDTTTDNNVWHRRLGHVPARVPAQEMGQPHAENEDAVPQLDDLSNSNDEEIPVQQPEHAANVASEEVSHMQLRRTSRGSKPPIWTKDYIFPTMKPSSSTCMYPMSNYLGYDTLSTTYQTYLAEVSTDVQPASYN